MANTTIYPYGTNGQLPSSIGIINDLTTGGADKALSAEMGKTLSGELGYSFDEMFNENFTTSQKTIDKSAVIMKSGETYKIHATSSAITASVFTIYYRNASGNSGYKALGATSGAVDTEWTKTPSEDLYGFQIYSAGWSDTSQSLNITVTKASAEFHRLESIEANVASVNSNIDWVADTLTAAASGYYLGKYTAGERINPVAYSGANYNVYSADVVEYERIKIIGSAATGGYGIYVFANNQGFAVGDAVDAGYSGTVLKTYEITVPAGAVKIYISENSNANGAGSTKIYRKKLDGEALSVYREKMDSRLKVTSAELQKYYDLGAQKMDTYNLVQEQVGIITIGQSNADGRLPATDFPSTANINGTNIALNKSIPTCKFMKGGDGTTYNEGSSTFEGYSNNGLWGFDQVLYNAIANALGNTDFYVCKQTRGDTSLQYRYNTSFWPNIDTFKNNSGYYSQLYHLKKLVTRALELQPNLKFKAIVMHQGEADKTLSKTEGGYYFGLCRLIQWVRGLVGSPNLPFIFGTVPTNSNAYSQIIYNDMTRVAADMENVYMIDMGEASGWYNDGYQQHFSATDAVSLADDMYKLMVSRKMLAPYV